VIRRFKVLVADPDRGVRRLIQRRLKVLGAVAGEAGTLAEALSVAGLWRPDALVVASDLDDGSGLRGVAILQEIRTVANRPLLCLVPQASGETMPQLLDCGADDCLIKPFIVSELVGRLHRLLRGQDVTARQALLAGTNLRQLKVLTQLGCVETDQKRIPLTLRQLNLLVALVRADGAALSFATIIEEVWGRGYGGSAKTLHRTVADLRRRVEPVPSAPKLIVNVRGMGYRFGAVGKPD
jgi:two-component system KDP operon response regulator KdpE